MSRPRARAKWRGRVAGNNLGGGRSGGIPPRSASFEPCLATWQWRCRPLSPPPLVPTHLPSIWRCLDPSPRWWLAGGEARLDRLESAPGDQRAQCRHGRGAGCADDHGPRLRDGGTGQTQRWVGLMGRHEGRRHRDPFHGGLPCACLLPTSSLPPPYPCSCLIPAVSLVAGSIIAFSRGRLGRSPARRGSIAAA
jgi:hypothetical protein